MICVAQNDLFQDREKVPLRNYILSSKKLIKIKTTLQFYQFKWKSAHLTVECTFSVEKHSGKHTEWMMGWMRIDYIAQHNEFICLLFVDNWQERERERTREGEIVREREGGRERERKTNMVK